MRVCVRVLVRVAILVTGGEMVLVLVEAASVPVPVLVCAV